ncbi:ABC transporter ATP-binding protein [Eoetvoesiella caeni]
MTNQAFFSVKELCKSYGALKVTDQLSFEVQQGECHGFIGPNGAGKTSLMGQLFGELIPDSGQMFFDGQDITHLSPPQRADLGMARSFQITSVFPEFSALDNVAASCQAKSGHSFLFWRTARGQRNIYEQASAHLERVGLGTHADLLASQLAHGELRQLELAMALAQQPRLLLLDEPMAGMSVDESHVMADLLRSLKKTVTILLVEHDMAAVFSLADRLTVLVAGRAIVTDTPDKVRKNSQVRQTYLGEG